MRRRILGGLMVLALIAGLAACGDDDDDGNRNEESEQTADFCLELVEFGTQASQLDLSTPEAVAAWAEEVGTQARELAAAAPAEIKEAAEEYAANAEDLADEVGANRPEAVNDLNNRLTASLTEMTTFAQQNCSNTSVPTTGGG